MRALPASLTPATLGDLFGKADAGRWALTPDEFADLVGASVRHAFGPVDPSRRELERYLASLRLADLALAGACALGRDAAWDHFVLEHRTVLYRAADALDPTGGARDVADAIYADLYGLRDGVDRRSLFRYFHGRSSLATWLRAVLAQRHVDAWRARRRVEPLPEDHMAQPDASAHPDDPDRAALVPLVENALHGSIDRLAPKDRLRLRSYYVSQLTLAEVGRITGEHEATVSRRLARTRRTIREEVERQLSESRLTAAQIARAFELALENPGTLDLGELFDATPGRKDSPRDRSRYEP